MRTETSLEERVARLEYREAIKELRAEYCLRIDGRDWDGYATLFADDARLDFGPVGEFRGRDEIREFAEHVVGANHPFLSHMLHNPVLDVDVEAETATGRWYFEVSCTFEDGSAGWIQGTYDDEYVREDGEWLFSRMVADFNYFADYEEGWAEIVADR